MTSRLATAPYSVDDLLKMLKMLTLVNDLGGMSSLYYSNFY